MPSDRDVGEFLLRELLAEPEPGYALSVMELWAWSGQIIERMRKRGFYFGGGESHQWAGWDFQKFVDGSPSPQKRGETTFEKLSPRTIALAAAKALGMEEKGGKRD